jgi:hypothetical protein
MDFLTPSFHVCFCPVSRSGPREDAAAPAAAAADKPARAPKAEKKAVVPVGPVAAAPAADGSVSLFVGNVRHLNHPITISQLCFFLIISALHKCVCLSS